VGRSHARVSKGIGLLEEHMWQTLPQPQEGSAVSFDITVQIQTKVDGEHKTLSIQEGGFAICRNGKFYAYRNHCPHVGSPLDWTPNQFFSDDGQALLCHTHGALFNPVTGDCISGPCPRGLYPIPIQLSANNIRVPVTLTL